MEIEIEVVGKGKINAILDERNPETARKIYENLPIEGEANIWLDEIYFDVPLKLDYENPSSTTERGDLSYWPPGSAFCIFYGKSQPASDVNNIGRVENNLEIFLDVENDDKIIIRKLVNDSQED
ncbi:MAG TPA: cyclophilin-like fold protein [Methanobacterium sp.]|nr:cyclophilin-like fold protein [Methanobacterium sp.]